MYREGLLHPKLRTALDERRTERPRWPETARSSALFLDTRGGRLSVRGPEAAKVFI